MGYRAAAVVAEATAAVGAKAVGRRCRCRKAASGDLPPSDFPPRPPEVWREFETPENNGDYWRETASIQRDPLTMLIWRWRRYTEKHALEKSEDAGLAKFRHFHHHSHQRHRCRQHLHLRSCPHLLFSPGTFHRLSSEHPSWRAKLPRPA